MNIMNSLQLHLYKLKACGIDVSSRRTHLSVNEAINKKESKLKILPPHNNQQGHPTHMKPNKPMYKQHRNSHMA